MFTKSLQNFIYSFVIVAATWIFSGYFNKVGMENFYSSIKLSSLTPPNYVFPIVWTILYILLIFAFYLVLTTPKPDKELLKAANFLFIGDMFLHILWCFAFFYCGHFLAGLVVVVVLDIITLIMMEVFHKLHKYAGLILYPYLAWLFFATYLNWVVIELNGIAYGI